MSSTFGSAQDVLLPYVTCRYRCPDSDDNTDLGFYDDDPEYVLCDINYDYIATTKAK